VIGENGLAGGGELPGKKPWLTQVAGFSVGIDFVRG
jgi:hypothetical protein